jgi:hypothetical protein
MKIKKFFVYARSAAALAVFAAALALVGTVLGGDAKTQGALGLTIYSVSSWVTAARGSPS